MTTYTPPPLTKPTSSRSLALLKRLKKADARFYGAYWCSHCFDQKEVFGKKFYDYVKYVECDKEGEGFGGKCKTSSGGKIRGYPTWEIGGMKVEGQMELDELEGVLDSIGAGTFTED
ncbi:hypothetical protein TeGR_g12648 [Tetraparma gracilis]|uniref:Thioredoxin domain-containing protein n=1 Tax=Tetraparma gracilis TaxID=2962635 RepID=A0ABQ6MDS2_9STRA|nr:hypothetical protein TeGR_g12648 [Tetraparma gracilis]